MAREKTAAEAGAALRRIRKLLRLLVVGGAAVAASCATAPKSAEGSASTGSDSKGKDARPAQGEKESGSGVRGW
jgi:hypothetical protein